MKRIKTRTNQYATVARNGSNIKNGKHRRAENKRAARMRTMISGCAHGARVETENIQ